MGLLYLYLYYILHIEGFSEVLLCAENVKQPSCAIVCSLIMGQYETKHVAADVL